MGFDYLLKLSVNTLKNLAVIQVRTDSKRLPGKALLPIDGIPIIGYMLKRLSHSKLIDKVIIATTIESSDNELCSYANSLGIDTFRGPKDDVLQRVYSAAFEYTPLTIIRLTGDCPLIDPYIVDELINLYYHNKADYAWIHESYAEGLDAEVFSFNTLNICNQNAIYLSEREHITQYIHNNKNKFIRIPLINKTDDSKFRIVVDEKMDYKLVSIIADHFAKFSESEPYRFDHIKKFLLQNPHLMKLNSNILRNEGLKISLSNDKLFEEKNEK